MRRLLFVVHPPIPGGGSTQIVPLRAPLAERGWEVVAVAPTGSPLAERLRAGGVETVELPLHRLRATPDPRVQVPFLAAAPRDVRALARVVRERQIDVVQPHGDTNPHGAIAARRAGAAVAWQLYDTRTPVKLRRLTMPLVRRLADVITTWGVELGRVHPGTETLGLGDRWIPVFPPVDASRFQPDPARRAAARAELGIKDDQILVAQVGNLNPTKGHEHFVRALAAARERDPRIVGRIWGAHSPVHSAYEQEVRAEAERLGLFAAGALAIEDGGTRIPELLPAADAFALCSVPLSEGMPTAILEAMALGLPVVATRVGAVDELVADGETGFVVEPLQPEAIAARLVELAEDPALRTRLGEAGAQRFECEFRLERLADVYAGAYERAIAHRQARRS